MSKLAAEADIGGVLVAAAIAITADDAERHGGVETMRESDAQSVFALENRAADLPGRLPGAEGIGALAVATAAAIPRRASIRLSPTCACNELSWDWKPALSPAIWLILTASVGLIPAATLVSRRSLPGVPNEAVSASVATEPAPITTEFAASACAPAPNAVAPSALAMLV